MIKIGKISLFNEKAVISQLISIIIIIIYFIGRIISIEELLALIPNYTLTIKFYFWTLITAGIYESSFFMLCINILCIATLGSELEMKWSQNEYIKFILFVNSMIWMSIFFLMIIAFGMSESETFLLTPFCGFSGICAAFVVAFKQIDGDRVLLALADTSNETPNDGVSGFQIKHVPILLLGFAILLWTIGDSGKESLNMLLGMYYGWLYLRFFKYNPTTKVYGDRGTHFTLSSFFPAPISGVVMIISTMCYNICINIGCIKHIVNNHENIDNSRNDLIETNTSNNYSSLKDGSHYVMPLNPVLDKQAERRRALAIKAIDEKLAQLAKRRSSPTDDMIMSRNMSNTQEVTNTNDSIIDIPSNNKDGTNEVQ